MKKWLSNKGFTLVEMMVVLLIISVLLLVTIPNIARHTATIDSKGCEAYKTQIAYKDILIEKPLVPTVELYTLKKRIKKGLDRAATQIQSCY